MNLLSIIIILVVVGIVLYVINTYLPVDGKIKQIINWVVIGVVVVWLLKVLGVWAYLSNLSI